MGETASNRRFVDDLAPGLLAVSAALPLALVVSLLYESAGANVRRGIALSAAFLGAAFIVGLVVYAAAVRFRPRPWRFGFATLAGISIALLAVYFFWVAPILGFHADFLIWSESMFVNDIIKFRTGYPLYTGAGEHQSFIYTPGAPVLTYLLASLVGQATSITVYRFIQIIYVIIACAIAVACCREILRSAGQDQPSAGRYRWGLIWMPVFLLVATNQYTNPFTSHLHNSGLQLVFMMGAFLLVLRHARTRDPRLLIAMAILPGLGYMVKQSFSIWAGLFSIYVLFFCREHRLVKRLLFPLAAFGSIGLAFGLFYSLWGDDYLYWTSVLLGVRGQAINLMRSVNHALAVWPYFAAGFVGAALLFSRQNLTRLLPAWLLWLILIASEAYTNGVAWKKHHLGPGSLIAAVWLMALLARYWPLREEPKDDFRGQQWLRVGVAVAVFGFLMHGMGALRVPMEPYPMKDLRRYVADIEREFAQGDPKTTLLDVGTWVYLPYDHVKKDSAIPIGDQGMSGTVDFSEIRQRLHDRVYSKIMVRNLDRDNFWYDWKGWEKSSGIRKALLENYQIIGKIREVDLGLDQSRYYTQGEITILVPK